MKIAIGGMQKNEMKDAILKACPEAETIVTTDVLSVKTVESRTDLRLRALSRRERYVLG